MKFSIKDFFRKRSPNQQETADLVTFIEFFVHIVLHILYSEMQICYYIQGNNIYKLFDIRVFGI